MSGFSRPRPQHPPHRPGLCTPRLLPPQMVTGPVRSVPSRPPARKALRGCSEAMSGSRKRWRDSIRPDGEAAAKRRRRPRLPLTMSRRHQANPGCGRPSRNGPADRPRLSRRLDRRRPSRRQPDHRQPGQRRLDRHQFDQRQRRASASPCSIPPRSPVSHPPASGRASSGTRTSNMMRHQMPRPQRATKRVTCSRLRPRVQQIRPSGGSRTP